MAGALNGAADQWGHLKAGHKASYVVADKFIAVHTGDLGQRSFVDLREIYG